MKQKRLLTNIGKDTFVRSYQDNIFRKQSSQTFQIMAGEVLISEPEPFFKQNMVSVSFSRGGDTTSVAYPGAFIDPVTGNLHGTYEGPIPGQMVMVGFENGNSSSPFVVNRYPYQGKGNTLVESSYINPLTRASFDSTDVMMGHFSGSYLSFNTGILSGELPGSVTLNSITNFTSKVTLGTTFKQDVGFSFSDISGNKVEITATGILLQDASGLNKVEVGPSGVLFTVAGNTYGASTHIHGTPVGPSSPPTPNT